MALTKVTSNVIADNAVTQNKIDSTVALGIKISNIQVTNSGGTVLDDTAVDISGGYIVLTGAGFVSGCQVLINNVLATSTTFVNSTTVRAQLPATAAGTYIVYVANPDGSVGIRVNGVTFSATPSWVTGSSLEGNVDTAISIQLSATEATVFALQSGSTLPAGLTLSSGGLISGTVTGLSEETVYSFTVIASDAENQDSPRTFSITITVSEPFFNRTVLAINGDVNTFVTDASSNSFPITINGDTKPSAFSPYNTNWSIYIDGSDDLNAQSNAAFTYGTADFTIEGWFYITGRSGSNDYEYFFAQGATTGASSLGLYRQGNVLKVWQGAAALTGTTAFSTLHYNRWVHIALTRSGTTMRLFLNGALEGSATNSSNITTGTTTGISIGRWTEIGDGNYIIGYVSNFRVVKGTAVYTFAFTPSTTPLTAITNTSLLACQDNRFIDESTNNFTLTKNGDTATKAFGPFTETDTTTGSTYFDGTNDNLLIPSNSALDLPADFTIECWVNFSALGTNRIILDRWSSGVNGGWQLYWRGTGTSITFFFNTAVVAQDPSATRIQTNSWYHIAAVRSGTTCSLYINGEFVASGTLSLPLSPANIPLCIGEQYSTLTNDFSGYISNVRIVSSALYTSNFIPPTTPLTAVTNTQLLTLQTRQPVNNHTFIDVSGNSNLITRTGNVTQGSFSPFSPAGWSNYFDGSGDYLSYAVNSAFALGAGDCTIECWYYPISRTNAYGRVLQGGLAGWATADNWALVDRHADNITKFQFAAFNINGNTAILVSSTVVQNNVWYHLAVTRSGNTFRLFVNGVQESTYTTSTALTTSATVGGYVGGTGSGDAESNAYISNVRILKGTALYTSNFTPPTSALTAIANTSLLTCQSNRFIDNSANNYTITRNGDTAVVNFSPFKPTAAYSPVTHGGSGYFDGSGDYTTATGNSLLLGSNNFTIEGWFYFNNGAENAVRVMCVNYTAGFVAGGIYFGKHSNNTGVVSVWVYNYSTGGPLLADPTLPPTKEWVHYALVRSGNNWTLYRNGVSVATATSSASLSTTNNFFLVGGTGESGAYTHNGYISGFKITNGTALYTSNFSVPTSPATASNSTSLLLGYNNAGIVDVSSRHVMETVGGAGITTSTRKYGTGSMYFDGVDDNVVIPYDQRFSLGATDFTVEGWFNFANINTNYRMIVLLGDGANGSGPIYHGWSLSYLGSEGSNQIKFQRYDGTDYSYTTTGFTISANTWYHIAVSRYNSVLKIFVDGVSYHSSTVTTSFNAVNTNPLRIGLAYLGPATGYGGPRYWNGYIDDLRITKGVARYTANFTPPTGTFLVR